MNTVGEFRLVLIERKDEGSTGIYIQMPQNQSILQLEGREWGAL